MKGKKTGGRKSGTPNKKTKELHEISARLGVDPFEVLLLFAAGDWKALGYDAESAPSSYSEQGTVYKYTIDPSVRARSAAEACQYMHAKRKAIELTDDDGNSLVRVVIGLPANGYESNPKHKILKAKPVAQIKGKKGKK